MEILGIGPLELLLIFLVALLVLGPGDMVKTGRTIGRLLNQLIKSQFWRTLTQAGRELRSLPTTLMREANLEDFNQEKLLGIPKQRILPKDGETSDFSEWFTPASLQKKAEEKILPPEIKKSPPQSDDSNDETSQT